MAVAVVATIINLVALLFIGVRVRHATEQAERSTEVQQEQLVRARKQATMDFVTSTMETNKRLKAALPYADRNPSDTAAMIEHAKTDGSIAEAIRQYLDYLEAIATGVHEGVLDLAVIDRVQGTRIISSAENFKPYIRQRRQDFNAPSLYVELETLAATILARRPTQTPR